MLKLLRKKFKYDLTEIEVGDALLRSYTLDHLDWRSLLFQTGYLRLHRHDADMDIYVLGYANREVRASMFQYLLAEFREGSYLETSPLFARIKRALDGDDIPALIQAIDALFAGILYQIFDAKKEAFFHAILHITFQGIDLCTQLEVSTAEGRVDCLIHAQNSIYVIEFKLDESADEALEQIKERRYGSPYLNHDETAMALGISFSSKTKRVFEWKVLEYEKLLSQS